MKFLYVICLFSIHCELCVYELNMYQVSMISILSNNTIICDCNALWLHQWIMQIDVRSSIKCVRPFSGIEFRNLLPNEFCGTYNCFHIMYYVHVIVPPSPVIILNQTVLSVGMNLLAICASNGIPKPNIIWTLNEQM